MNLKNKCYNKWWFWALFFAIGISTINFIIRPAKIKELKESIASVNMADTANSIIFLDSVYKSLENDSADTDFGPIRNEVKVKLISLGKDPDYIKPKFISVESIMQGRLSAWDGSLQPLVDVVKEAMHDPDSFDHSKTYYERSKKDSTDFVIIMFYRGKNAFGAKVKNNVKCIYNINTRQLSDFESNLEYL